MTLFILDILNLIVWAMLFGGQIGEPRWYRTVLYGFGVLAWGVITVKEAMLLP